MMNKKIIFSLIAFCFVTVAYAPVYAQDGGPDEFFEEEEEYFDEPVEEENSDPGTMPVIPPRGGSRGRFGSGNNNAGNAPSFNSGGSGEGTLAEGEVVFRLVDPPKYWKPKKRKVTKPPGR